MNGKKIAVTGPSRISARQAGLVVAAIRDLPAGATLLSGAAAGVDTTAARHASQRGLRVHLVKPSGAHNELLLGDTAETVPGDYMARNERLAELCDELIAFVKSPRYYRSGEWATIKRARDRSKPVRMVVIGYFNSP